MNINKFFFQTMFHMLLISLVLISVNSMFYDVYGYVTIPYFNFELPNHSLNLFLMVVLFYTTYFTLSHLTFFRRVLFSGIISMYVNIFYDMLWNFFYIGANKLPFYNYLNLISLTGITAVISYILYRLDKDFCLFTITKKRTTQLVVTFVIVFFFLVSLSITGFFKQYFNYTILGAEDPHNFLWASSRIASFGLLLPILRWKK